MGICYMTQGTQTGALKQPRGLGWGRGWSIKQLSFNLKIQWQKRDFLIIKSVLLIQLHVCFLE